MYIEDKPYQVPVYEDNEVLYETRKLVLNLYSKPVKNGKPV